MSIQSDKFRRVKSDLTPYLFHFISGRDDNPAETLKKILDKEKLISERGFICFTASPVTSLDAFFETKVNSTGRSMYQPYGIGFSRDILIREYGARNLMYFSKEEIQTLDDDLKWRSDELDVDRYDFEWLREWRTRGKEFDFSSFPKEHIIVIAPTANELLDVIVSQEPDIQITGNPITGDMDCYIEETYKRKWKGFTLKQIALHDNDIALSGSTITQIVGNDMSKSIIETVELEQK